MDRDAPTRSNRGVVRVGLIAGLLASAAVVGTLAGPGITIDEPLDVRPGRAYLEILGKSRSIGTFLDRDHVRATYADNAEHPPLGRWLLGLASTAFEPIDPLLGGPDPYAVHAARVAPAIAFGLLVGLIASTTARRYGVPAGWVSAFSLVAMPRLFAHAHLAALDTLVCLTWTASLLAAVGATELKRPRLALAIAGFAWGLALLTKIHGWLLPPIVLGWAVARLGVRRGAIAFAAWVAVGLSTFLAGWPWLWYDTSTRLRDYLVGTSIGRLSIRVTFFGAVYADRDVPWHYPWFYALATIPVGLLAFGAVGVARGLRGGVDRFAAAMLASVGLVLAVFSTRVAVYDGERLVLVVFPLLAILIGRGGGLAWDACRGSVGRRSILIAFLLAQAHGVVTYHPFGLSYYNGLVGGLRGAERLGLEVTYWGDAIDPVLLDRLAAEGAGGADAAIVPTLHHAQATADMTPGLVRRGITLRSQESLATARYAVVHRRSSYWPAGVDAIVAGRPLMTRSRQGVWLSGVWELKPIPTARPAR